MTNISSAISGMAVALGVVALLIVAAVGYFLYLKQTGGMRGE